MKVIFLDIDGVINLIPQGRDEFGSLFHPHLVENLKRLVEATGAKIVISSTWRLSGLSIMKEMWNKRELPGDVIDITSSLMQQRNTTLCRGEEIELWLNDHPEVTNYVILDDDTDMNENQINNFVRTSDNPDHEDCIDVGYGLTTICTDEAINILNA